MAIPKEVLDDLASRFLTSLPQEEREDPVRVCFHAEKAHWFYMDNLSYYEKNAVCPKCGVREFIRQIFKHCSFLQRHVSDTDMILDKWREYKVEIPTHGAILLDASLEYVLLVQGFHAKASWGFPKGKCNEEELPQQCAIREVKEETGFDITPLLDENEYFERNYAESLNRLYIVTGVPREYAFKPTTRNEIKECRWFLLDKLPSNKVDSTKSDSGINYNHFYMVFPYVEQLRRWVAKRRGKRGGNRSQGSHSGTPPFVNGDHRRSYLNTFSDDRQGRYPQRTRSVSHSSPVCYNGFGSADRNRQYYSHATGSDKQQSNQSSTKQQSLNRKKKMSACKQKLDFDPCNAAGSSKADSSAPVDSPVIEEAVAESLPISGATGTNSGKTDIQLARAWQQFKFNWEPILPTM